MSETKNTTVKIILTGILATLLVLALAALCTFFFEVQFYVDWVATVFMAATPAQVIIGLLWHNEHPAGIAKLSQPAKGIALTGLSVACAVFVMALVILLVSGGHGITPMLVQFMIVSVITVLWIVPIWQCWPISIFVKNPVILGIITLLFSYTLAYTIWQVLFDYELLATIGHPLYFADIAPTGLFDMWIVTSFLVTTVSLIVVHMLFEFWPINKLSLGMPQPIRGMVATAYLLSLAWFIRYLFVDVLEIEQVDYMVRGPVSLIFGVFLVNNMMQFSLFPKLIQPIRGVTLTICALMMAFAMYELYESASMLHAGSILASGPQGGYSRELWIASAMLGVTFPIIFIVSGFFAFWPLQGLVKKETVK